MNKVQITIFVILAAVMVGSAFTLGRWAEQINPDGISAHPNEEGVADSVNQAPRNAFSFGVSMGLLGSGLLYCCIAIGLLIQARSKQAKPDTFIYWIAGLAGLGLVLSYLIDDYFV